VGNALFDELELDGADTAIVHIGWSDAVSAGLGICDSDIGDAVNRQLIVQAAVIAEDAAVTVRCVFAEANVDGDEELGEALTEKTDGGHDGAFWVVGGGAEGIFRAGGERDAEEYHGFEAFADEGLEVGDEFVDAAAVLVGEGGDDGFFVVLVGYEEGVYEH
jgi:hypothetical protein